MRNVKSPGRVLTTEKWAQSLDIPTADVLEPVGGYRKKYPYSARAIAGRAVILHCVVAVASGVSPEPVVKWLKNQRLWKAVSPKEKAFFTDPPKVDTELNLFRWWAEAEWALLWVVGKVEMLGLPVRLCDTRRLNDEIIPALGSNIAHFLSTAQIRSPDAVLAEEDRHYNLWCMYIQTRKKGSRYRPKDLNVGVLYQREYVFEWLQGHEEWDSVQCDA
jgi:Domain of unknown function (DUF4272)